MDFIELIPKKPAPPARRTKFFPILGTLLTVVLVAYFSLPLLGKWLGREDPIHPADAIAVLSGHFSQRAIEAVHLYRQGYAHEIWLTFPKSRGIVDRTGKFHPNSEDLLNFALLRGFGVPPQAIRVLDTPIVNTADELNAIDAGLKEIGGTSVIIVTNKAHTRRVFSLWDKYPFLD